MMNASEARKKATSVNNTVNATLLAEIEKKIEQAVANGATSVNVGYISNPTVIKVLLDAGYTAKNMDDQREQACWCTISW